MLPDKQGLTHKETKGQLGSPPSLPTHTDSRTAHQQPSPSGHWLAGIYQFLLPCKTVKTPPGLDPFVGHHGTASGLPVPRLGHTHSLCTPVATCNSTKDKDTHTGYSLWCIAPPVTRPPTNNRSCHSTYREPPFPTASTCWSALMYHVEAGWLYLGTRSDQATAFTSLGQRARFTPQPSDDRS